MHCIVLYCIVLYCIVLYCIVLYCIVLYCIALYCIVLYCTELYFIENFVSYHCIILYISFHDLVWLKRNQILRSYEDLWKKKIQKHFVTNSSSNSSSSIVYNRYKIAILQDQKKEKKAELRRKGKTLLFFLFLFIHLCNVFSKKIEKFFLKIFSRKLKKCNFLLFVLHLIDFMLSYFALLHRVVRYYLWLLSDLLDVFTMINISLWVLFLICNVYWYFVVQNVFFSRFFT